MEVFDVDIIVQEDVNMTTLYNKTNMHDLVWTYGIFMPITCIFGIFGNLLTLYVMLANGKKFNGYIFLYMKGLAIIDILQIIHTIQVCTIAVKGYI